MTTTDDDSFDAMPGPGSRPADQGTGRTGALSVEALEREARSDPKVSLLRSQLRRLTDHLLYADVEEIAVNRPGEVWQKLRRAEVPGQLWRRVEAPELDRPYLMRVCHLFANLQNIPNFGPDRMPVLYGTIPGGHRFAAGVGTNFRYGDPNEYDTDGTIVICLRQSVPGARISLSDYGIDSTNEARAPLASIFTKENDPPGAVVKVMNSLTRGDHILVSGQTGSGKTTMINHLIQQIPRSKRILTVEDTRELYIPQPNRVQVLMSRTQQGNAMTYSAVRDLVVRMTPDVVLAGEVSNANAETIWDLMTTGHGHFMTTVHAENSTEAIRTFIGCIEKARAAAGSTSPLDREALTAQMREKLRIVQLGVSNGRRVVTEIM